MTMSLSEQSPLCMSVSADTAGGRQFLPEAHRLANCLLLADAGYIDRAWFEQVMSLYRCRWQVELLFKEWKSHNRLKGFVTGEKAIAEGLVWTSLLSLVMKRRVAQSVMTGKLSMLKASKNSTTWWLPLLEAVAHRALTEIRERLEWAADYLAKSAYRTKQRKSIQNRTLEDVLKGLNA
jgi:hypothetical protein